MRDRLPVSEATASATVCKVRRRERRRRRSGDSAREDVGAWVREQSLRWVRGAAEVAGKLGTGVWIGVIINVCLALSQKCAILYHKQNSIKQTAWRIFAFSAE